MVHIATRNNNAFQAQAGTSLTATFTNSLQAAGGIKPWESIIDFATHPSFCGLKLYPRQQTLLKLIHLETENMTAYDLDVIEEWRMSFARLKDRYGVQPDIWQRVEWLKSHGYTHFPHVQAVQGRRASKGVMGGILGTERIAHMVALDNPQEHYGIMSESIYLMVIATNSLQAKRFLFADIRKTVANNKWLSRYVSISREQSLSLRTPADIRMIAEMQAKKIPIEYEIASVRVLPMSSVSTSGRGAASFCLDPDTRVLTSDLRWVSIGTLQTGDTLVGVDEEVPGPGQKRKLRKADVQAVWRTRKTARKLIFEDGSHVICSNDHKWMKQSGTNFLWTTARSLKPGHRIAEFIKPWEEDNSFDAGYLAGIFDGEGWVSKGSDNGPDGPSYSGISVAFSQKPGDVADRVLKILDNKGFNYGVHTTQRTTTQWSMTGKDAIRFMGQYRPIRFMPWIEKMWEGKSWGRGKRGTARGETSYRRIASIEELPEQELVDITTSTRTFIAEGLVSHNCIGYDEMAHMITGTGGNRSSEEVYEAYQPSLDQFGKDALTYIPSSPFSKIGRFYELYTSGSVLLKEFSGGKELLRVQGAEELEEDPEETFNQLSADPTMLVIQLPSWELYKDWERGRQLVGIGFKRAVQYSPVGDKPENLAMARLKQRNPVKFKVEREAQFAEVMNAYLNVEKVDAMFTPFWEGSEKWPEGRYLERTTRGMAAFKYQGHADPSKSGANFAVCVAHLETSPIPDIVMRKGKEHEIFWPHVIVDYMNVWKPGDYEDHIVDYVEIGEHLMTLPQWFPTMNMFSYDQWNSAGFIANMKRAYAPRLIIKEEIFEIKRNQAMFEGFKSALNLGWVHSYKDDLYGSREERAEGMGQSLLELECKYLSEKNGKVVKQEAGPVTTKDLFDCVATVTTRLLKDSLDLWYKEILGRSPLMFGSQGGHPASGPAGDHLDNGSNPQRRNLSNLESYRYSGVGASPVRGRLNQTTGQPRGWGQRPQGFGLRGRLGR